MLLMTGKNWNLKNLNRKFYSFLVVAVLLLIAQVFSSYAPPDEKWKLIRSVKIPTVSRISSDPYGFVYFSDSLGNVFKYDTLGNQMVMYSPEEKGEITLLEAYRNVNILLFFKTFQQYLFLNRFLAPSPIYDFNQNEESLDEDLQIGYARLATNTLDQNLWIIDENDFTLKKYDLTYNKVTIHTSLDLLLDPKTYDLNFMREYQNLLFINDRNSGILVFDNLANYKNKLPFKDVDFFSFQNDDIYFLQDGFVRHYNIYTGQDNKTPVPQGKNYQYVILGNKKAYFFSDETMDIYECSFCKFK